MVRAIWNGVVIAESDETKVVEGNYYFPRASVMPERVSASEQTSVCPWKGVASYLDVTVDGATNAGAAWHYPKPKPAASEIADHVAFWKGVEVIDDAAAPKAARRGIFGMRR